MKPLVRIAVAALAFAGCNLVLGLDAYKIEPVVTVQPECTTNAECTARLTAEGPFDDAGLDAGTLDGGIVPGVCVKPDNHCVRVLSPDCTSITGDYLNDNAVLLGTLFSLKGSQAVTNLPRQRSATLAAEEINSTLGGSGLPPAVAGEPRRPLVVVSCDESGNLVRAGTHLADDLHVPAIVGPNTSQDTLDLTTKLSAAKGMLLMSPTSVANSVASLADNNLTWRDIPSDSQRSALTLHQIAAIEAQLHATRGNTLKLGIVYRDDALGQSALGSISGNVQLNGKPISDPSNGPLVKISRYDPTQVATQTAIAQSFITFQPDIVVVFGTAESVTNVLLPFEQGLTLAAADAGTTANRAWYVLIDSNKVQELINGLSAANVPADLRTRIRGTGVTPEATSASVFGAFNTAYSARFGDNPRVAGMGPSYDGMYALAYALAATTGERPTGASIARGLAKLGTGTSIDVGASTVLGAFQRLTAGESISPRGTFGVLKWDANGDIVGGTVEIWCIGLAANTPYFGSSGLKLDVATQVISGTYTQCQ